MHLYSFLRLCGLTITLTAAAMMASACTGHTVKSVALSFDAALETSNNKQVFLNVIRSSYGYPLHFSSLGSFSGQSPLRSAKLEASLPFGRNTLKEFSITPSLGLRSKIKTLSVKNINAKDFAQAIVQKVSFPTFDVYTNSTEWRSYLVYSLFVGSLTLKPEHKLLLDDHFENLCASQGPFVDRLCSYVRAIQANCSEETARVGDNFVFVNNPDSVCDFELFQSYMWRIITTHPVLKPDPRTNAPDGYEITFHQRTHGRQTRAVPIDFGLGQSEPTIGTGVTLRSPMEMILYVGKLVSAQLRPVDPYMPEVLTRVGETVPLFVVRTDQIDRAAAVSVRFRGELYRVPQTGFDDEAQHQSMKVLALISELLSAQTARDALRSSTITLN